MPHFLFESNYEVQGQRQATLEILWDTQSQFRQTLTTL